MRLGFIGTGKIASSVITGVCTSKISFQKILISRRNKNIAQKLKKNSKKFISPKPIKRLLISVIGFFYPLHQRLEKKYYQNLNLNLIKKLLAL